MQISATKQKAIAREARKYVEPGIVLYLDFERGLYGYNARCYRFPKTSDVITGRKPGKFYKTKFFAVARYNTWREAAAAAKEWLQNNKVQK